MMSQLLGLWYWHCAPIGVGAWGHRSFMKAVWSLFPPLRECEPEPLTFWEAAFVVEAVSILEACKSSG